jgi:PEP-CTERM motif
MKLGLRNSAAIAAIAIGGMLSLNPAASNAALIIGGMTDVVLTSADVLSGLGVTVAPLGTATIESTMPFPTSVFPITGGSIGAGGALIQHDGSGLELSAGGVSVDLQNFLIDTAGGVIDGLVTIGSGPPVGVLALFTLGTGTSATMNIPLTLTMGAADALNTVFFPNGGGPFSTETQIGVASTFPTVGGVPEPTTWGMMLLGFAGLGIVTYRRSANSLLRASAS